MIIVIITIIIFMTMMMVMMMTMGMMGMMMGGGGFRNAICLVAMARLTYRSKPQCIMERRDIVAECVSIVAM